jgi:hypothetical protein
MGGATFLAIFSHLVILARVETLGPVQKVLSNESEASRQIAVSESGFFRTS